MHRKEPADGGNKKKYLQAKKALRKTIEQHDDLISSGQKMNLMNVSIQPQPYNLEVVRSISELRVMARLQAEIQEILQFGRLHGDENLFSRDFSELEGKENTSRDGMSSPQNLALVERVMKLGVEDIREKLCRGEGAGNDTLRCYHLHRRLPGLRLGPLKLEVAGEEPFIGVLRDVHSASQMQEVGV